MEERYYRQFLNREEGIALVELSSKLEMDEEEKEDYCWDSNLLISDCSRQICLDFYVYLKDRDLSESIKDIDNRIYKASVLKATIDVLLKDLNQLKTRVMTEDSCEPT